MITEKDIGKEVYFLSVFNFYIQKGIVKEIVDNLFFGNFAKISVIDKKNNKEDIRSVFFNDNEKMFFSKRQVLHYIFDNIKKIKKSSVEVDEKAIKNSFLLSEQEKNVVLNAKPVYIINQNHRIEYGIITKEIITYKISMKWNFDSSATIVDRKQVPSYRFYDMQRNMISSFEIEGLRIFESMEDIVKYFSRKIKEL